MKKFLLLILLGLIVSSSIWANKSCHLPESIGDLDWQNRVIIESLMDVGQLSATQRQQILVTAKRLSPKDPNLEKAAGNSIWMALAINDLIGDAIQDQREIYVLSMTHRNKEFTAVVTFLGDSAYGLLFLEGQSIPYARVKNYLLYCL